MVDCAGSDLVATSVVVIDHIGVGVFDIQGLKDEVARYRRDEGLVVDRHKLDAEVGGSREGDEYRGGVHI